MNTRQDKVMTLSEAIREYVKDGSHISIGGFTINRNPMAAVYEIIRQGIRNLHLYAHSNGQGADELIGGGCVSRLDIAYGGNGKYATTCIRFRKAVQEGTIQVEDYSNFQMTLRFMAGAMGMPFLPTVSGLGTDLMNVWGFPEEMRKQDPKLPNRKMVVMENPFDEWMDTSKVVLVPAIQTDITILHVQKADKQGTGRIRGLTFADVEQAKSAKHLILTCEELVDTEELRKDPDQNNIPFIHVDAVVPVPHGAYPTACYRYYDYDPTFLWAYAGYAKDDRLYREYLEKMIHGVRNHEELIALNGGPERLARIKADPKRDTRSIWPGDKEVAMGEYTLREMMTIVAAREIRNGDIVFCGTGISMLAAMAAKNINAPESVMYFETGRLTRSWTRSRWQWRIRASCTWHPPTGDFRCLHDDAESNHRRTCHRDPGGGADRHPWQYQYDRDRRLRQAQDPFSRKRRRVRRGFVRSAVHSVHAAGEEAIHEQAGLYDKPGPFERRRTGGGGRIA